MGRFLILGKEERQKYLFQMLCSRGQTVTFCDSWLDGGYDAVLLPAAKTADYLERIADKLQAGEYVFGCNFPAEIVEYKRRQGIFFIDYMKEEGAAYTNAAATAEGAVVEAVLAGDETLFGKEMLVMGYGRCGQILAQRLQALGGKVTVFDKDREKLAMAESYGLKAVCADGLRQHFVRSDRQKNGAEHRLEVFWGRFAYIFNTIPALVLDAGRLSHVRRDVVLIDIASKPGGIDYGYCERNCLAAKLCGGLPAKYAPKSAAELLMKVIEANMKEVMSYDAG